MKRLGPLRFAGKFRKYQQDAIRIARRYRAVTGNSAPKGACLVCHPTGTGKTAVIAGISHASPEIGSVLIVTTREAVRDQLVRELAGDLFINPNKFGLSKQTKLTKATYVLRAGGNIHLPASDVHADTMTPLKDGLKEFASAQFSRIVQDPSSSLLDNLTTSQVILVMTIQMLATFFRDKNSPKSVYSRLAKSIDIILFDEGHYEPAVSWSDVVRGLKRPLVLLSATPFRNDLKPFQVKEENIHIYQYRNAWKQGYIRQVKVEKRRRKTTPSEFCADMIDFCEEKFGKQRNAWPRIIIHCDEKSRITQLGDEFEGLGFKVIGIHDKFPDNNSSRPWQKQHVPPPQDTDAEIWIHQYKLMEGIDDHRFQVLAFYDLLKNVRSVVQQVGRVIRIDPKGRQRTRAYVLDHYDGRIEQYWDLYEKYDKSLDTEYLSKSLTRYYLDKFAENLPSIDYVERKFRSLLKIDEVDDVADEILFDRRVTFRRVANGFILSELPKSVEEEFDGNDYRWSLALANKTELLYLYATVISPSFLHSRYFAEVRHGVRLFIHLPASRLLAIADSTGSGDINFGKGSLSAVHPKQLERLITGGRVNSVSSKNTNLGNRVIRRRSISAPSIAEVPPILDEYGHILSTITGYNGDRPRVEDDLAYRVMAVDASWEDQGGTHSSVPTSATTFPTMLRRYVGMSNGRVSEIGSPLRLQAYRIWVQSLAEQMGGTQAVDGVFQRYAGVSERMITDSTAKSLLLDIYDLLGQFVHLASNEPLQGDELCVDRSSVVSNTAKESKSRFKVVLNGEPHWVDVLFAKASQRYRIESSSIDQAYVATGGGHGATLTRILNDRQSFNIIPDDLTVIYVHGRFYSPPLKFGANFSRDGFYVGQCLYPCEVLKGMDSEKGRYVLQEHGRKDTRRGKRYDPNSTFGLIDSWSKKFDTASLKLSPNWVTEYAPEPLAFEPTMLICDDMHDETSDFILADEVNRRFVLIHAKASSAYAPYSAGAVQEICAQAQKNAALLSLFTLREPANLPIWGNAHEFTGKGPVSLTVIDRIRKPLRLSPSKAWAKLAPLLRNPLTSREVWLVLGNMVSAKTLADNLQKSDPPPEALQLNHLLHTTIAAMGSAGAKTRIFCVP